MTTEIDSAPTEAAARSDQYVVVARRYRPQTFGELVGQQHIAKALEGAIRSNRVGHAYLFTGARGVGKTSAARILGKALNCVHGPTPEPCNQCDICLSIASGDDVDVLEIDGASNRGIDEIRELRQKVNVRPSRSRYKIYIIDEVHMLTREAFNALLKTLEEPPEHVKFIFCTTEPEKIPITILSRCQRFDFSGIQTASITERLRQIVESEGVETEPEALELLARRAAGSMRDSQSLLEQLLAFGGSRITVADVHRMLGTAAEGRLGPVVQRLVERDAAGALQQLSEALAEGVDVGQLLEQLLGYFRDLMVAAVGCPDDALLYALPAQRGEVRSAAEKLGVGTLLAVMQILDQTLGRLRYSTHGRTLAELALVRICSLADLDSLPALIEQVAAGQLPMASGSAPSAAADSRPRLASTMASPEAKKKAEQPALASGPATAAVGTAIESEAARVPDSPPALAADQLPQIWKQVLEQLSDLTSAQAAICDHLAIGAPNRLVLGFREKYTSCKSFCERPEQLAKIEKALSSVTGRPIRAEFVVLPDLPDQKPSQPRSRQNANQQRLQEVTQDPLVRRAMELFEARPVRVENPEQIERS
jgi:DNA polymerase-3 subunit gamma/tau